MVLNCFMIVFFIFRIVCYCCILVFRVRRVGERWGGKWREDLDSNIDFSGSYNV